MRRHRGDGRGVSEVVDYLLGVVIVGVLVSGLVVSANAYFESREDTATAATLEREGQELSRTIGTVDRLVRESNSSGEIGRRVDLPSSVGSSHYTVAIVNRSGAADGERGCDRPCLVLSTGEVTQRVYVRSMTPLAGGERLGGDLYVVREPGDDTITLREVE